MSTKESGHYMDRLRLGTHRLHGSLLMALLLLVSGLNGVTIPQQEENIVFSPAQVFWSEEKTSSGDVDAPSWRVGDEWTYDGFMDVAELLAANNVQSNIQTLTGDLDMWVEDIRFMDIENQSTLVYEVRSHALFEANNVNLDGNNGNLDVDYDQTDIIRVSDLAVIQMVMDIDVTFTVFIFNVDVGQIIITNDYSPPKEFHDFPIWVGDTWTNNYTNELTWSGDSDYFAIPADEVSQSTSGHGVVAYGDPGVPYGAGCAASYNLTSYNSNGTPDGFQWYCPAVSNDAWRHYEVGLGLVIDFKLKSIQPVARDTNIDVDLRFPTWVPNGELAAWVNITDANGNPKSGQTVEFRYECVGYSASLTTAANGSAHTVFNTSNALDPSPTSTDYASHGVIAWMSSGLKVGVETITLDDQLALLDYLPRSDGVSVDRTRDGDMVSLNPEVGYNAIPGDSLEFTVPVLNKGVFGGPSSTLEITAPDGTTSRASIPALGSYEESRVSITWNVPPTQPVGIATLEFEVDPDGLMTDDANQSNDLGSFEMFIGRMPIADLIQPPATKTRTSIPLDARNSVDPDGGSPHCTFVVEVSVATNQTFDDGDCLINNTWEDDGTYNVWLTITDDENDQDHTAITVTILNRAPWVNVTTHYPSIPVETTTTFYADDSGDLDTRNSEAPLDFLWQPPTLSDGTQYECEEGLVGMQCTVTPLEEGMYRMEILVEDDDGATTSGAYELLVTNIAPNNVNMTMWRGEEEVVDNRTPPVWLVYEDEVITLRGEAHDSLNDMDTLTWGWQPDLDYDPNWYVETIGSSSEIEISWETGGGHVVAMEVIDDDGESSGVVNGWVDVRNVPPVVEQFDALLPVGEDRLLELTGTYNDTQSDIDTLRVCWDIDFQKDLDLNGDTMDDCDFEGAHLSHSWPRSGDHVIRFHVTDDDGDQDDAFVNVTVVNLRPKAVAVADSLTVKVGEEVVIWANGTTDTESDMASLRFEWDLDIYVDSDDDGDPANDLDIISSLNEPFRHVFHTEGTKNIRLLVTDEDKTAPSIVDITITVEPDESGMFGWINKNTAGVSNYVVILGLVLVALLVILAFTMLRGGGRRPNEADWLDGGALLADSPQTSAPPTYAFGEADSASQETALSTDSTPALAEGVQEQSTTYDPAEEKPTGSPPAVPIEGLPPGWTQEQWEWYGHEWLQEQQAAQQQPESTEVLDFDL